MLKKTMTYEGYNGEKITEDFYFSISKAELIEMEMKAGEGGYSAMLAKIIAEDDRAKILDTFREIIMMSVGRRSDDGKRFIKNQQIRDEFEQCPAYSDLLVEFYTQVDAAVNFVVGIVPGDMAEDVKKGTQNVELPGTGQPATDGAPEKEARYLNELTPEQIEALPWEQFKEFQGRTQAGRMDALQVQAAYRRQLAGK
jgi:hypothetical protein